MNACNLRIKNVLGTVKEEFDKAVPMSTKVRMLELRKKPALWKEICKALYRIPSARKVDRDDLIQELGDSIGNNDVGYVGLDLTLEEMKREGYIVDLGGSENYVLTKEGAKVVEVNHAFEEEIVPPISEIIIKECELQGIKHDRGSAESLIYEAIK